MEFHEVCSLFPVMTNEEFAELKSDIAVNGQLDPISTYHGKIGDGRRRYRACSELQIAPKLQEWDGEGSLLGFVTSKNLTRRNLSASQKAAIVVELKIRLEAEIKEATRTKQKMGGHQAGAARVDSGAR